VENYSTLTRDKSFQKKTFKYIAAATILIITIYGAIFIAQNYFAGNTPSGAPGSSYASIDAGTNAWSQLLEKTGIKITKDKGSITLPNIGNIDKYSSNTDVLDFSRKTQTVVVLNGSLPDNEIVDVQSFVESGGRLITDNPDILYAIFEDDIFIDTLGAKNQKIADTNVNGLDGLKEIEGSGIGSIAFSSSLTAEKILIPSSTNDIESSPDFGSYSTAAIIQLEEGDVIALMDTGIVTNAGIARKDNALLSIRIVGDKNSEVIFAEGIHGFSSTRGFYAFPLAWRISIIGLIASLIVFGSAKARRFGVGEEAPQSLGPKRIQYAKALAHAMKKSKK
jgi:hypothetical protein